MYTTDIKTYDPDEEDGATFATWAEAEEWLSHQRGYFGICPSMWVNNKRVEFVDGKLAYDKRFFKSADNSTVATPSGACINV